MREAGFRMPVPLLEERGVLRNLLFMHGWAGSGAYFDETLKHLDLTGLRAVTVDLRAIAAPTRARPATSSTGLREMYSRSLIMWESHDTGRRLQHEREVCVPS